MKKIEGTRCTVHGAGKYAESKAPFLWRGAWGEVCLVLLFLFINITSLHAQIQPVDLTCEMMENPLSVEVFNPRFGWKLLSNAQGEKQTAYQITVTSDEENIWDTGKINSDQSQFIQYNGKKLRKGQTYKWKVQVWDAKGRPTGSQTSSFQMAPEFLQTTQWIGAITRKDANLPTGRRDFHLPSLKKQENIDIYNSINPLALRSIRLSKTIQIDKPVKKATAYVCGLGQYNFTLSGIKLTDDVLTPAWSDYDKTVYYNTYQINPLLLQGEKTIDVTLGNGFYNTVSNRYRKVWVSFGPPTLFFEMYIEYADGTKDIIQSDQSWKYALSPTTFNDIYGGEDYDARLEKPVEWKPIVVQEAPTGILRPQQIPGIKQMQKIPVKEMEIKSDTVILFTMKQNVSGYPYIKVSGKKGQTLRMIVGEALDKEGFVSQKRTGGPHTYQYTLKGTGIEEWHPEFTYYGFQYIQVEGIKIEQIKDIYSCFIYNSTKETGTFECSNLLFNKIHWIINNAVKSNMQSVFTDCPQREKLGWLEETHLNGAVLLYNYDLIQIFPKVMRDIADGQRNSGLIPSIVPEYVEFGGDFTDSPEWGSAGVIVPWMYYKFYGDNKLIIKYYNVMKKYVDYLETKADHYILSHGLGDWYDYGDHPAGYAKNSPIAVSATSHYYYAAHLLAKAAEMLQKQEDLKTYSTLATNIKNAFNAKFFNQETKQYGSGSQFCNAVAIYMNIVEPQYKQAVLENLKKDIIQRGYRLTTGDVGNRYLYLALALNNENEILYKMHNHEEVPGYGYQVKMGVTTLTEQWDPNRGNSWNHFMMGQIDEWFYRSLAGIEPVQPGFKEFTVAPVIIDDLKYVKATYTTLYGDIKVDWKRENNQFFMTVEVPVNTKATIVLPNGKQQKVGSGKHNFEVKN